MTVAEIEEYAQTYAPAYKFKDSTWNKNKLSRVEMFKKTVLKRLLRKTAPLNPVVSRLLMQYDEEQSEERNAAFEGIDIKGTEEQEQKPRKSRVDLLTELYGENPDPVKDSTWKEWEALQKRAAAVGVEGVIVDKAKTTEGNLKEYMQEILVYVTDAERQAQL